MGTADSRATAVTAKAAGVLEFWQNAGVGMWFHGTPAFDREFRDRFLRLHEQAASGVLAEWSDTPIGAFALILLLDQFPRNAFRGTARAYLTDTLARQTSDAAIDLGHDRHFNTDLRGFFYMPFMHAESMADQDRSVALQCDLGPDWRRPAARHREIILRFGRFPHRNAILGRDSTPEEQRYLAEGGFSR